MSVHAETLAGRVCGKQSTSGDVVAFLGIPYAKPPVGALRWCAPEPVERWSGTRDASRFAPIACQRLLPSDSLYAFEAANQSEDCLYLNVWTTTHSRKATPRPVIVWLHIGAFQYGSSSATMTEGANWVRAGAVLVSLNYRLGRLGFLAHRELTAEAGTSGNYGLLDQIAALEWVRDNISAFGGDPGCVTIFGVSAGASSVSLLMNAPRARGLFHRAIAESGGSFGPVGATTGAGDCWQSIEAAEISGERWATAAGASSVSFLREFDSEALREANCRLPELGDATFDALRPIVDGHTLPCSTYEAFAAGHQAPVPLLVGSAAREEFVVAQQGRGAAAYRQRSRADYGRLADAFLELYPGRNDEEAARSVMRAVGDRVFTWQNWVWASLHARRVADTYYYRFEQAPPVPRGVYSENRDGRSLGAFHGASLFYSFGNFDSRNWAWSEEDRRLGRTMTAALVRFAKTGRPAAQGLPEWPRFNPEDPLAMALSASARMIAVPDEERMRFWDEVFDFQHHLPTSTARRRRI